MIEINDTNESVFGIPRTTLHKLIRCISTNPKVEQIILYGSRAKGTYKPFSDIDLTLKGNELTHRDLFQIADAIDDLYMPYEVDLSLWKDLDYQPLLEEIERHGRILD